MSNRKEFLKFFEDSILIESIMEQELLLKQADSSGLFNSLGLPGVADSIKTFIKTHVNPDGPGGYVGSVLNLMAPSILFRAHPLIGILYLVASQFGFDLQNIFSKILEMLRPKLEQGQKITSEEISNIGKSVIANFAGVDATAAPEDYFESIKKYAKGNNPFGFSSSNLPKTPLLFGGQGGLLQRIFGQLFSSPGRGKSKAVWLLGGFVIWIIKTVLVGAGLVAGAEAISSKINENKNEPSVPSKDYQKEETTNNIIPNIGADIKKIITNVKNKEDIWIVPILGGNLKNTLIEWVKDFYPEKFKIPNFEQKLTSSEYWQSIFNQLNDPKKISAKYLVMPDNFSSRKEVVDEVIKGVV